MFGSCSSSLWPLPIIIYYILVNSVNWSNLKRPWMLDYGIIIVKIYSKVGSPLSPHIFSSFFSHQSLSSSSVAFLPSLPKRISRFYPLLMLAFLSWNALSPLAWGTINQTYSYLNSAFTTKPRSVLKSSEFPWIYLSGHLFYLKKKKPKKK